MTTQHSTVPRRLRRRSDERVLGGVASGLGDYFNVDPILIRILLVASLVFGGLGLFLYLAAWLLVPDETSETSILERTVSGAGFGGGLIGGILLVVVAVFAVGILGSIVFGSTDGDGGAFLLAVVVIGVGAYLLRRDRDGVVPPAAPPAPTAGTTAPMVEGVAQPQVAARPVVRRQPRPPSPLGWYAVGAGLVGIGVLALASSAGALIVEPAHYVAVAFAAVAAGLLVGTFWGHARFLIVVGVLLLPFAWTASLVDVPLDGAWGSTRYAPATTDAVLDEYRLSGGRLTLDLTDLDADTAAEPITIDASVAFGQLQVLVPEGTPVEVDATVGGGEIRLFDGPMLDGTRLTDRAAVGDGDPTYIIDLEAGLGSIEVDAIPEDR